VSHYEPTSPSARGPVHPIDGRSIDVEPASPSPVVFSPEWMPSAPMAKRGRHSRVRRLRSNACRVRVVSAGVMTAVIGLSVGLMATQSASAGQVSLQNHSSSGSGFGSGGSNARSSPAPGGASGTIGSTSKSSFTLTTSAGQKVSVDETSTTKYEKKSNSTTASAITKGEQVLVLGTVNGTTIASTQVIVESKSASGSSTSAASKVIPFNAGAPTTSKQVGQIPANWSQGSGTIVSGTAANKATEAALAAYPGGIADRVVKLSNGEYNVHYIGVNWPHHVFVNQNFKVVGAL